MPKAVAMPIEVVGTPTVAIVGRPNVGKSTLFNRLTGQRTAITSPVPGTTRDRISQKTSWNEQEFTLMDTGGWNPGTGDDLLEQVRGQAERALSEANLVLFMVDAADGPLPIDVALADMLRRGRKPVLLVVNKVDSGRHEYSVPEFYALGLGDPIAISAYHNRGIYDLMENMAELLSLPSASPIPEASAMKIAVVGRPNVGKSMLVNAILGEERVLVSEKPGTTRDAVDTWLQYQGKPLMLIDTAGIRRRGRIQGGIERYSVLRAVNAVQRADVVLLVLDAQELVSAQDMHLAGLALNAFKGMVVVVNKWDMAKTLDVDDTMVEQKLREVFRFIYHVPICFVSALRQQGIPSMLAIASEVFQESSKQLSFQELKQVVEDALVRYTPPSKGRAEPVVYEVKQSGIRPPTFTFQVSNPHLLPATYKRYLENRLRDGFGYRGVPLRLVFASKARRRG